MTSAFALFTTAFVSRTVSALSAGKSVLFVALLSLILSSHGVAPVVTIVGLIAGPMRMAVF